MDKFSREIRAQYPAPDGTALGNLRHTLAVTAEDLDSSIVVRATSNIYDRGAPGDIGDGKVSVTGITLGDLRELASLLDVRV